MENKMKFSHKLAYSFFDFSAYKEFLIQGFWKSIFYIFLVTLTFSTIANVIKLNSFNSDMSNIQKKFMDEAPTFTIKDGMLSIDSTDPIYYKHDGQTLIVDTSGKTTSSVLNPYSNGAYIDTDSITFRQNYNTVKTLEFKDFSNLILNNETITEALSIFKIMFNVLILFFDPILSFFSNLISVFLILGPCTLILSALMGVKLSYSRCCTLSFYAMTSSILIDTLLDVAKIVIPQSYILFYLIALIYCGLAINKLKNINKSNLNIMK